MNPFNEKARNPEEYLVSLKELFPEPYDKNETPPYTKARIVLATGAEFEANWHSHQMQRHVADGDLRKDLALTRFVEKQQQQKLSQLKPPSENILETTITYEQLAVDLTAAMAKTEKNFNVKKALDFALLEDFDHLYRYANMLDSDYGVHAEMLVGGYTEIIPARPTFAHHRHPLDNVRKPIDSLKDDVKTVLNTLIITAAEQQTMNFYMNAGTYYKNEAGKRLYQEICLVEEEHVTQYGSLIDNTLGMLECNLWHEYTECYLYWSNYSTETDERMKKIWEYYFEAELSHLAAARKLLKKYRGKDYDEVIPNAEFPEPIELKSNIDYVREILNDTVQFTSRNHEYKNVDTLEKNDRFFAYNAMFNDPLKENPSHKVISAHIEKKAKDYRFEKGENPIPALRDREIDNLEVGYFKNAAKSEGFKSAHGSAAKTTSTAPAKRPINDTTPSKAKASSKSPAKTKNAKKQNKQK